jgi:hypothetical protein
MAPLVVDDQNSHAIGFQVCPSHPSNSSAALCPTRRLRNWEYCEDDCSPTLQVGASRIATPPRSGPHRLFAQVMVEAENFDSWTCP